jgi:hypothetical protein
VAVLGLALVVVAAGCGSGSGDDDEARSSGGRHGTTTTTVETTTTTVDTTTTTGAPGTTLPPADPSVVISLSVEVTAVPGEVPQTASLSCGDAAAGSGFLADPAAAQAACNLLHNNQAADQRLIQGPDPNLLCIELYGGPEVAKVSGIIHGQSVNTTIDRTDGCGTAAWDLLNPLLTAVNT